MTTAVIVLIYLIGIPLSVIVMSFVNKKMLDMIHRAEYGEVIALSLLWPGGLPVFFIISIIMKIYSDSDRIRRYLEKFIEGE